MGTGYHKDLEAEKIDLHIMHIGVSRGTVQLAVDWLSHTVYWTDSVFRWIVAAPGQLDKLENDYFKIIVDKHLDAPDGLALDPINGLSTFYSTLCTNNYKYWHTEKSLVFLTYCILTFRLIYMYSPQENTRQYLSSINSQVYVHKVMILLIHVSQRCLDI